MRAAILHRHGATALVVGALLVHGLERVGRRRRRDSVHARLAPATVGSMPAPGRERSRRPGPDGRPWPVRPSRIGRAAPGAIGSWVRRAAGRPADADADLRLGQALLVGVAVLVLARGLVVATAVAVAAWSVPVVRASRRRARARRLVLDEAPEVVDLVRLGVGSGLNVRLALEAVARHHRGRLADDLVAVLDRADRGERLADALDAMPVGRDGAVRPLVDALVASERYGAPLLSSLDRVADDARTARRRRREEAARRVPVKLLFPLVFCTLPAFALLTVVPVLLRSLPSLAP